MSGNTAAPSPSTAPAPTATTEAPPLDLAIVILSYNVAPLLRGCLASLRGATGGLAVRTIVVDNRSSDGSAAMARTEFPEVLVVESPTNGGFSHGNNLALRELASGQTPRYVLLLNPDTVMPPASLRELVAFMDGSSDVGASGPRLLLPTGALDPACRRGFPSPWVAFCHMVGLSRVFPGSRRFGRYRMSFLPEDAVADVDSVVGACMLVRGEVLRRVGPLDERFFMYGEDLDWAFRIKRAGWRVVYNGRVVVHHHKRASSSRSGRAIVEFYRSMLIFFRKHYAATTPAPLVALVVLGVCAQLALALAVNRVRARRGGRLRPLGAES